MQAALLSAASSESAPDRKGIKDQPSGSPSALDETQANTLMRVAPPFDKIGGVSKVFLGEHTGGEVPLRLTLPIDTPLERQLSPSSKAKGFFIAFNPLQA